MSLYFSSLGWDFLFCVVLVAIGSDWFEQVVAAAAASVPLTPCHPWPPSVMEGAVWASSLWEFPATEILLFFYFFFSRFRPAWLLWAS